MQAHEVAIGRDDWERAQRVIASGQCRDAAEIFHAGLAVLEQEVTWDEDTLALIRARIQESRRDYERGDYITLKTDEDVQQFMEGVRRNVFGRESR